MKKTILLIISIIAYSYLSANRYFPLINETSEWGILYTSYPYEFQMAKTTVDEVYVITGDTAIDGKDYKKICLRTGTKTNPVYYFRGAIREENRKVFYIGNGYNTYTGGSGPYNAPALKNCLFTDANYSDEILLYDFSAKAGDELMMGYFGHCKVLSVDSVLVGNSYRRRWRLNNNDDIVEGIGSTRQSLLYWVTPIPLCSSYFTSWQFSYFTENGQTLYKTPSPAPAYQSVYSNRKAYYSSPMGFVQTIYMDSVRYNMSDSVFYPVRTMEYTEGNCFTPNGGMWMGKKVILKNGVNYFFNRNNDTIILKTNAKLNESWTLFKSPNTEVKATVLKWDTANVLGVSDSVKTIRLEVFDNKMTLLPHKFNGALIQLSQHYGIVKAPDLHQFPESNYYPSTLQFSDSVELTGIVNPALGTVNLTWLEVHDFQPGDEFHTIDISGDMLYTGYKSEKKMIERILNRTDYPDSVIYNVDIEMLVNYRDRTSTKDSIQYFHYNWDYTYTKNKEFDADPGIQTQPEIDNIHVFQSFSQFRGYRADIYSNNNGCWNEFQIIDDACNSNTYAKGRGLISSRGGCWETTDYYFQVYYKKGNTTWGVPLQITSLQSPENLGVKLYPNPFSDILQVELSEIPSNCTLEIMDMQGKILHKKAITEQQSLLSLRNLSKGLYFYRITSEGLQIGAGKITKN